MINNILTQYSYNLNKGVLALPSYYSSFKAKCEHYTKADMDGDWDVDMNDDDDEDSTIQLGSIGIIDFKGFTVNDANPLEELLFGCISMQRFQRDLTSLVANEQITQIVINFDSGGGYIMGVQETAELVATLATNKPIYAYTSGLMCSAAYKVASQCSYIVASPSSMVGSVGVYCEYMDATRAMENQGIVVKTFQGGSKKTIGSPYITLTPEQETEIQDDINGEWEAFKATVKANRGDISEDFLQGQAFTGLEAMELNTNLIDSNCNSIAEFVELLSA